MRLTLHYDADGCRGDPAPTTASADNDNLNKNSIAKKANMYQ